MKSNFKQAVAVVCLFIVLALILAFGAKSAVGVFGSKEEPAPQGQMTKSYRQALEDYEKNGLKGMWISYLEFLNIDFSSEESFERDMGRVFDNCAGIGLNTVIVQVRPFGDALYRSSYFPFSHIMTGAQGQDPGFDPLAVMTELAHKKGLRIEAWINPYRVKRGSSPARLSPDNPANNESLTVNADGNVFYNPALSEVKDLVTRGVEEIVNNYRVDGIHFDDYFYPSQDESVDRRQYSAYNGDLSLADWRRENVNALIRQVYAAVKGADKNCVFGISPRGNRDNNYNLRYSDSKLWLETEGYADYIMPQLYWGFNYADASGDRYAFKNICREWASYRRSDKVKLYIGLAAYRIGDGDGGKSELSAKEWNSGSNLSKMISFINSETKADGYCLYRYDNLFTYGRYENLQKSEAAAVARVNRGRQ